MILKPYLPPSQMIKTEKKVIVLALRAWACQEPAEVTIDHPTIPNSVYHIPK